MNIFNLPDLGEGLPDAEIHEWFVQEGDTVTLDMPLVSMETAKAIVDVPCPQSGVIKHLFGKPGDVIKTGEPLVEFMTVSSQQTDKGTVVGKLEESVDVSEDDFIIGSRHSKSTQKTTLSARILAKKFKVDLNTITASSSNGVITQSDVQEVVDKLQQTPAGYEPLRGVRRAMLNGMVLSHRNIVPVSIFDEVDIDHWPSNTDITVRLIRAIEYACHQEPALNAWFDTAHSARRCFQDVHLGIAMDHEDELFVPVIQNVSRLNDSDLRQTINHYKMAVSERTLPAEQLKGATITLSNFGKFSGRFATPIIIPPMVAILAVGRLYSGVVSANGTIAAHRLLPLSLSFDHRAVTGGEATRFLGAVMASLQDTRSGKE
jgi:pyruvate dehydrogenase E2 component (dihydrolipoamide acetyltransferase)